MTTIHILEWDHLTLGSPEHQQAISNTLQLAFGSTGTGLVAIRNVPGFKEAKSAFLPMAHQLVHLNEQELSALEDKDSLYNAGWSYGKEKLGDKPDFAKGSFYYNPITDTPGTELERQRFPLAYPTNKWPSNIPNFEQTAKRMGQILTRAAVALCPHLDLLANQQSASFLLQESIPTSQKVKARLLYYFPIQQNHKQQEDSWIGWHNDSGFLTALSGDLYVQHATGQPVAEPDPAAGLYVVNRQDQVVQVHLPPDCCAIQIGECTQIVTNGAVTATPHCVKGSNVPDQARISLAVFVDMPPDYQLIAEHPQRVLAASMPTVKVPPLQHRWTNGMLFGDFLKTTFEMYYNWSKE